MVLSTGSVLCSTVCSSQRIFRAQFRPDSDSTFVTVGVKHVKFWSICGSSARGKRGVLGATTDIKMQTMLSIAFGAGDLTFTGSMSGDVYVWKGHILNRTVSLAHEGPVFSMFTTLRDGLIVTGGKDKDKKDCCCIKLWDQEMRRCRAFNVPSTCVKSICRGKGKIIVGTRDSQIYEVGEKSGACSALVQAHGEGLLSGLACHPTSHTCCTVSMDNTIRIWDVGEKLILHCIKSVAGGTSCAYNKDGHLLAVGLCNGQIVLYEPTQMAELDSKRDRGSAINDLKFSPDGLPLPSITSNRILFRQILAAASNESVDIYNVSNKTLQRLTYIKHSGALQLDFSDDGKYLQVATEAYEKKIFLANNGEPLKDKSLADQITWHTWTSFLGPEVAGIWPRDANPADINTAHVSQSGNSLVTGDDSGFVKLFRFPCPDKHTPFKKYTGHSAHVTGARFMCDDARLITTGGDDCCVFVWKTEN